MRLSHAAVVESAWRDAEAGNFRLLALLEHATIKAIRGEHCKRERRGW